MKKLLVLPIMLLYMLAMSGVLVHAHYCGGELASWELFQKPADACGDDGCDKESETVVAEEDGCCKDKVVRVKITSEQSHQEKAVESFFAGTALLPSVFPGLFPENTSRISGTDRIAHKANAPPGRWQNLPLYKLHMRFTFYG